MHKKILFAMLFLMLLIVPTVSATLSFSNYKNFIPPTQDARYGQIDIYDGNIIMPDEKVAEFKLLDNTDQCLIDCSAHGVSNLLKDQVLFDNVKFLNGNPKESRIWIVNGENYEIDVPDQEKTCKEIWILNKTSGKEDMFNNCSIVNKGSHKETRYKDKLYFGEILKAGTYEWRIEAKKSPMQKIDWIGVSNSVEMGEWTWWDASWSRKKQITINGTVTGNYSALVWVSKTAIMQSDYDDLRFLNGAETTELPYFIQSYNTTMAKVWVFIQNNQSIYMYYGNNAVSTTSNVNTAFYLGDDFNDGSMNTTKWTLYNRGGTTCTITESGTRIGLLSSTGDNRCFLISTIDLNADGGSDSNYSVITNYTFSAISEQQYLGFWYWTGADPLGSGMFGNKMAMGGGQYYVSTIGGSTTNADYNSANVSQNSGINVQEIYHLENSTGYTLMKTNDLYTQSIADTDDQTNAMKFIFGGNPNNWQYLDWIAIRPTVAGDLNGFAVFGAETGANSLAVTLNSPVNYFNTTNPSVTFNCSATDETGVLNLTLIIDEVDNHTITGGAGQNLSLQVSKTLSQYSHNWTCRVSDGSGSGDPLTASVRYLMIDYTAPVLSINNPNSSTVLLRSINYPFNFTASDVIAIDQCWYNLNDGANKSFAQCNSTISSLTSSDLYNVTYNGRQTIKFFANDTMNNNANTSVSFYVFNYTQATDGSSYGEGGEIVFNLTLFGTDINSYYPNNNITQLTYDGYAYYPDTIDRTHQNYTYFEKTLSVPLGSGNSTGELTQYSWTYNLVNSTPTIVYTGTTSTMNLTIWNVTLTDCAIASGRVILNMSLKDEELNTLVNITTPNTAVIEIDMDVTSLLNSSQIWNFHKKWESNNSVAVCVPLGLLNDTNYKIDFTVGYDASGKVREFYYMDNGTLDNTNYFNSYTDNTVDLMDLASADSTTFLFTFTDADGLEIDDALIHTFRKYIGEELFREVERSKQDNNGETHLHLVEEDVIYYFMITQYGNIIYTSDAYNAKCLSTPCAISLSASPSETNWSIIDNEGGKYSITADKNTRIATLTFNLDSSSLINFSLYSYNGANATFINGTSLTAMAGSEQLHVPLAYGNKTFFAVVYNNNTFVKSQWIDLTDRGQDYFGTFGGILAGLVVLSIMLMAVSEGAGFIVFTILALIVVTVMKLVDLNWMALISIICAGAIILWKLINRRNKVN